MEQDPFHNATREQGIARRPGEASRQPIDHTRPSDIESGLSRTQGLLEPPIGPMGRISSPTPTGQAGAGGGLNRKKTLVRPERRRMDPTQRNFHYLQHTQQQGMNVQASTTGLRADIPLDEYDDEEEDEDVIEHVQYHNGRYIPDSPGNSPTHPRSSDLIRGKSILDRDQPAATKVLSKDDSVSVVRTTTRLRKRGTTIKRKPVVEQKPEMTLWTFYCRTITCCIPPALLRCFGIPHSAQQAAWREKIGLISIILCLGVSVGFLTFGFTEAVCSRPPVTFEINQIDNGYLIIHGLAYDLTHSSHPAAIGVPPGSNVLYPPVNAGGLDASFMFQNVNSMCKGLITAKKGSEILTDSNGNLGWYFPCNLYSPDGSTPVNYSMGPYPGYACHTMSTARQAYYNLIVTGQIIFDWDSIANSSRNLIVYSGNVLDLNLLEWLDPKQVDYPSFFDDIRNGSLNALVHGQDATQILNRLADRTLSNCLVEIIRVGTVDATSVGCLASQVVLYISLVFIIGIVVSKFFMALWFHWFLAWRIGSYKVPDKEKRKRRDNEIEEWSDDIFRQAALPDAVKPGEKRKSHFFPRESRFTPKPKELEDRPKTGAGGDRRHTRRYSRHNSSSNLLSTPSLYAESVHSAGGFFSNDDGTNRFSTFVPDEDYEAGPSGFIHESVVPQPPAEYQPFGYPLAHTICLVTTYNESIDGLRTTFDSIATSQYPNSHKILFVISDGMIKGAGESRSTPEYVISMMKDLAVPADQVQAFSYAAIASGYKRHNMAKVYAGFYDYDDTTVAPEKQQRVPMICVVKTGTPREATEAKPGNRGKRDSQIILMSFLQKVLFDERMTELEFEIFNGIWKVTGLSPDIYDMLLMVDADTKIFPDALNYMVSAMQKDGDVMGLCGETKIANKRASWVSMIQVFEYFISHHLTKAFESVFGGVTCLPGCFRIKAPKGEAGYFVPVLANPDIVSRYQEDNVDTLHKKNLLLLGEDRYLSTLMLKTFPHRKQIFVPQAVCKTIVPDRFRVLLSQRRRWINSTIHNLMELFLVRDLCGTFCFSMQFVVFIELVGTCVLPAAIGFTIYVICIAIVRRPVPLIPLILLSLILGLPAVLIVLTAKRWSYVGWMLIYILSLIIWNFVLPLYAFWNFDDFSWGDTRRIEGETKSRGHGGGDGEFDSSQIVMKRWAEFERDRRRKQAANLQFDIPPMPPMPSMPPVPQPPSSREPSSYRGYEGGYI